LRALEWPFGIFCGNLVSFFFWYITYTKKKYRNPDTKGTVSRTAVTFNFMPGAGHHNLGPMLCFLNIFAEKLSKKFGVFDSKQS
jgi:hypothetical protein